MMTMTCSAAATTAGSVGRRQPSGADRAPQRKLSCRLAERQPAVVHRLDSLGADVIADYPGAPFGEGDGEWQPDMTAAADDHNVTREMTLISVRSCPSRRFPRLRVGVSSRPPTPTALRP